MTTVKKRIHSIDILRGIVMVIMALDHTRDFFHNNGTMMSDPMDPDTTNLLLYFTRWITHFCAPTFVFLSGISAYLSSKNKPADLAGNFLIKRGIWLILVEITVITFGLTFNPLFNFIILQVIWSIGWSMLLLGVLSRISHKLVTVVGILLFFGHNIIDYLNLPAAGSLSAELISILFTTSTKVIPIGSEHYIGTFYSILPWTGAMLVGFSIGRWFDANFDDSKRKQYLFYSGLGLFLSFLLLRYFSLYGNPTPREAYADTLKNIFGFFNVSKYPPSLQYYGMTLGPALMILASMENLKNWFSRIMMIYGKVPFFYYVLHFYLIHIILVVFFFATGHGTNEIVTPKSPFLFRPNDFGYHLPIVYVIWLGVVAILYRPCIWFQKYKTSHAQWWMKYL
jgi:uncharacterized membrane protein